MTLTVRLDASLEAALERYCDEHAVTKSEVVVRLLASYLSNHSVQVAAAPGKPPRKSPLFEAFERAGLIGGGELGGSSAGNAAVRARVTERVRRRQ